jgi:hypothetical protein
MRQLQTMAARIRLYMSGSPDFLDNWICQRKRELKLAILNRINRQNPIESKYRSIEKDPFSRQIAENRQNRKSLTLALEWVASTEGWPHEARPGFRTGRAQRIVLPLGQPPLLE